MDGLRAKDTTASGVRTQFVSECTYAKLYNPLERENISYYNMDGERIFNCLFYYDDFHCLQMPIFLYFCFTKLTSPGDFFWQTRSKLSHTEKNVFLPRRKLKSCCVRPQASIKIHGLGSDTLIRNFKQIQSAKKKPFLFQAH